MNRLQALSWPLRFVYRVLLRLHQVLQDEFKGTYNRNLPFSEELIDRWDRARQVGLGAGTSVYDSSYIYGDVVVGENCWIGPLTIIDGSGGLTIGKNTVIAAGVHIYSHDVVKRTLSSGVAPLEKKSTTIEHNCFIGAQSVIASGVRIGHHSVIGAQSYVKKSLPPFSIAAGTPARVIGKVVVKDSEVRLEYL